MLWGGDDLWHRPVADDPAYRESYYFDFADQRSGIGGFSSIGWKPARGVLGATTVVFSDTGAWMHQATRATEGDTPLLAVEGLSYARPSDRFGHWLLALDATVVAVEEFGTNVAETGAGSDQRAQQLQLAVEFRALGDPVCTEGDEYRPAFSWHLEQAGGTTGSIKGESTPATELRGLGHRDRSYGPRDWTYFASWMYMAGHSDEVTLNLWALQRPDGHWSATGWFRHAGRPFEVVDDFVLRPREMLVQGVDRVPATVDYELRGARDVVSGTVESLRLVPLGFQTRRGASRLDRGMARYTINGQVGSGQVEYQQLLGRVPEYPRWTFDGQ